VNTMLPKVGSSHDAIQMSKLVSQQEKSDKLYPDLNKADKKKYLIREAILRWHRVLMMDISNEAALMALAENYINVKDTTRAATCIKKLKKIDSVHQSNKYYEIQAKFYALKGDPANSILCWSKAIEHGSNGEKTHLKIASQYLSLGDTEKSLLHLDHASQDERNEHLVLQARARCYLHKGDHKKVISLIQSSSQKHSSSGCVLLFKSYMAIGDTASVESLILNVKDIEESLYYYLNGLYEYSKFNYKSAIDSFRLAANIFDHTESKIWLIKSQNVLEREELVIDSVRSIEKSNKSDLLIQGKCWEAAGQMKLARIRYTTSSRRKRDYQSYLALVNFHFNNKNYGKALYSIRLANKIGIRSGVLDRIENKIKSGIELTGNQYPGNIIKLSKYDFYINENIFKAIVTKYIDQYNARVEVEKDDPRCISRIALFISSLGPGGAERQVVNLANGLVKKSNVNSVSLFCTHLERRDQDRFYQRFVDERIGIQEYYTKQTYIDLESMQELSEYAPLIKHIQPYSRQQVILHMAKTLIDYKPDVVHAWLDETFINAALVCGMLGITNVVGRWGSMPPGVNRTVSEKDTTNVNYQHYAYKQISRLLGVKYSSNSMLTGKAYASILEKPSNSVSTVYNGVDPSLLSPNINLVKEIKEQLGIETRSSVVGTVFRMSEEKRPFLWVDVAERISEKMGNVHFVIVGSGPLENTLIEYIEGKELKNIHLVGKQENVADWYSLFDLVLMTSRVEGVSNVVIESQFCGTPVIAPNVGGLPEAVVDGETGYLLDEHGVESFANQVKSVLSDDEHRRNLGDNARSFVESKFSIPVMVEHYTNLYCRPLAEHCLLTTEKNDTSALQIETA